MGRYLIEAPDGRSLEVEGDAPPTQEDADEIFSSLGPAPKSSRTPEQRAADAQRISAEIESKSDNPNILERAFAALGSIPPEALPTGRNIANIPNALVNAAADLAGQPPVVGRFEGFDLSGLSKAPLQVLEEGLQATYPGVTLTQENAPTAGMARSADATLSGLTDPDMALTLPAFSTGIPQTVAPIATAGRALVATEMMRHLPEVHANTSRVFSDPNATTAQKAEAALNQITADAFAAGANSQVIRAKGVNPDLLPRDPNQMAIDQAAVLRLGLPPRARPEPIAQAELTRELIDRAIEGVSAPHGKQRMAKFEQPLEELRKQQLNPFDSLTPEEARRRLAERPGGGEAIGGKVSFNQSAESIIGKDKPNATKNLQEKQVREQQRPVTDVNREVPAEASSGNRPPEGGEVEAEAVKQKKQKPAVTKWGKKAGDIYNDGNPEKVVFSEDKTTSGIPTEYTVKEYSEVLSDNEVGIRIRDMTPEEIAAKKSKIKAENELARELGLPEQPIPEWSESKSKGQSTQNPPIRPGDTAIKIQQPDGTVIDAVSNGQNWEVGGERIPNVGRAVEIEPGKMLWSDGPLRPGERIISPTPEATPKPTDVTPQSALTKAEGVGASELEVLNNYLSKHPPEGGKIPARKPYSKTRDEAFAEKFNDNNTTIDELAGMGYKASKLIPKMESVQSAILAGEKLGYHPQDIAAYLKRNYKDRLSAEKSKERGMEVEQSNVSDVAPSKVEATPPNETIPSKPAAEISAISSGEQSQAPSRVKSKPLRAATAKDWKNRDLFPGEDFAAPPNSIVIQLRGLDANPIGSGKPIVLPFDGNLTNAGATIASGIAKAVREKSASFRESHIFATDSSGAKLYQFRYNPAENKVSATSYTELLEARKKSRGESTSGAAFESGIKSIESLQNKLRKGPQSGQTLMGVPSAILDTALEAARLTLKAGKPIAEAIEAAIRHIRYNTKGKWDESKVRSLLERELGGRGVQPADSQLRQGAGGVRTGDAAPGARAGTETASSEKIPTNEIDSPEGQKPRSFSARATVSEKIPEPVQEAIAKDPRSSYTPQRISEVKEQVRRMSDAELGALTPESDIFTEGKAELADRLFSEGKLTEGLNVIQQTSESLTKAGQIINQAKVLNAMKPESRVIALDEMLKKAGKDPMTEAQKRTTLEKGKKSEDAQKRVDDATKEWERNPTPENAAKAEKLLDEANNAALDFQQWAHRFEPKTTPGILKAILQGNLLTPMSQTANLVGNMSFLPFRIGTRSLAAGMNILQNALLGQKRTASVGPISGTAQAARGLAAGARDIPSILKRGTGDAVVGERKTQLQPIKAWINQFSKNPDMPTTGGKLTLQDRANLLMEGTIGIPAETMLRLLGAGDRPFREAAKYRATAEQLRLANVPKEQWSFAQKFPELFFDKEKLAEIKNQSDYAVFQRQSKTLNVIQRWIAEKGPWFDFAVATVAPYKVTPWNIIGEILSYNPVVAFSKALRDASQKDSRSMNLNASKFIVGSLMTTAATVLYQNGLLSPSLDAKDETMKERILSGQVMPPNHINVSGLMRLQSGGDPAFKPGDKTVDIMRGGGLFGAFAYMVANVGRDLEKSPDAGTDELIKSIITQSTLEQARFGMNQSFLSGVEGLLSAVKDGNADSYIQKWGNTVTSIPIPNTSSAVSRATREYKPDLTETTFNAKVKNLFANKLGWAGLDDYIPLKRGLWGEPLRETPQGREALIYQLFDVSKGQQITSDPVPLELYRLWRKTADRSVIPTPPLRTITVKDKTYPLNAQQYEQLAISIGKSRKERVDSLFENAFFMELSDEQKIEVLEKAYKKGAETGKKLFLSEHGDKIEAKPAKTGFKQL